MLTEHDKNAFKVHKAAEEDRYEIARNDDYEEMRTPHCPQCGTKLIYGKVGCE